MIHQYFLDFIYLKPIILQYAMQGYVPVFNTLMEETGEFKSVIGLSGFFIGKKFGCEEKCAAPSWTISLATFNAETNFVVGRTLRF